MPKNVLWDAAERLRQAMPFTPNIAVVLGSGLGGYLEQTQIEGVLPYSDLPGFPVSSVPGHAGRYLFCRVDGVPVIAMQGRVHLYEGYTPQQVVLPIRAMGLAGAQILLLTNAAGGLNPAFSAGDVMLLTDQISSFVPSPLIGQNLDSLGPRFPEMGAVYDHALRQTALKQADKLGLPVQQGVYIQLTGPNFETPAEVRMCQSLGADAVGMSTAIEAVAARHMGMRVCGLSCITNLGCGLSDTPLSHEEVQQTANRVAPQLSRLLLRCISAFGKEGS